MSRDSMEHDRIRSILVPTDGSDGGRPAVAKAVALATDLGAQITALHVIDLSRVASVPGLDLDTLLTALRKDGEAAVAVVEDMAREAGVPAARKLIEGHPSDAISEEARHHDLVVMGTLGRTGLAHLLVGSVTERVIRHAPCPVMVVRLAR